MQMTLNQTQSGHHWDVNFSRSRDLSGIFVKILNFILSNQFINDGQVD